LRLQSSSRENIFDGNSAVKGGGIDISEAFLAPGTKQASFELIDNLFIANKASDSGGGLSADANNVITTGNTYIGNRAEGTGGAIMATSHSRLRGTFQFVEPTISQKPLEQRITAITIEDSVFLGNVAAINGGAVSDANSVEGVIYVPGILGAGEMITYTGPGLANVTINNSLFFLNKVTQGKGGAIGMTATGQHAAFILNPFQTAVPPWQQDVNSPIIPSSLTLMNSVVTGNKATRGGGVYINAGDVKTLNNNIIRFNSGGNCVGCN
jgi:hypothetical protein